MPIRKTRVEQVEANAVRLLAAALKVFTREGFHGASLEKVAAAAGLTKGAVYARFETKADLMLALLAARVDERILQIGTLMAAAEPRGTDTVAALARQWAGVAEVDPDWWLLVLEFRCHAARSRALNAKYARIHARLREGVAGLLARRLSLEPEVAEELARISMAASNGYVLERAVDGDGFPSALFQRATTAMLTSIAPPSKRAISRASKTTTRGGKR